MQFGSSVVPGEATVTKNPSNEIEQASRGRKAQGKASKTPTDTKAEMNVGKWLKAKFSVGELSRETKTGLILLGMFDLLLSFGALYMLIGKNSEIRILALGFGVPFAMSSAFIVCLLWAANRFIGFDEEE